MRTIGKIWGMVTLATGLLWSPVMAEEPTSTWDVSHRVLCILESPNTLNMYIGSPHLSFDNPGFQSQIRQIVVENWSSEYIRNTSRLCDEVLVKLAKN